MNQTDLKNLEHILNQDSDLIAGSESTLYCHSFMILLHRFSMHKTPLTIEEQTALHNSMNIIKEKWDQLNWNPAVRAHGIKLLQAWSLYKLSHRMESPVPNQHEETLHSLLQQCCNKNLYKPLIDLTKLLHALINPSEPHQTTWSVTRDHLVLKEQKWRTQKNKKSKTTPAYKKFLIIGFVTAIILTGFSYENYQRFQHLLSSYGDKL